MKSIVLISSGQPSVNPRLVKEANALTSAGFKVKVLYSFWIDWAYDTDKSLFKKVDWIPLLAGGAPLSQKYLYVYTKVRHKIAVFFAKNLTFRFGIAELSKSRAFIEMLDKAKIEKADLYIAHNLAALPVAALAAKFNKSKYGFDAEDFHRQEITDDISSYEYQLAKYLEDKYFKGIKYISASSSQIASAYKTLYPTIDFFTINNVFESSHIQKPKQNYGSELRLFWFSQTIGKNRGLEDLIKALAHINNSDISLHLLGKVNSETKEYFNSFASGSNLVISYYPPIDPERIFEFANKFDVGLALENYTPLNRNICLTNKIFTYLNAGLAVIVSDTVAQKEFLNENFDIGELFSNGDIRMLSLVIKNLYSNRSVVESYKSRALILAKEKYNWEKESQLFIGVINKMLI